MERRTLNHSRVGSATQTKLFKKSVALSILLLIIHLTGFAQQKFSGRVTGIGDEPLFGAGVLVKSSQQGTTADADGNFTITALRGDILVVSNVGYLTKEIQLGAETSLHISLTPSLINLDEVVVTGYTSQKKKEIAGSVASVKPEDLVSVPAGQVEQMLQGRVAGLTVISSGIPGAPANIRLHGIGNFGNVTPLYIIDGVQGDINSINPYDIESLQVLKDAVAYSIYGVRGANGVIVLTTKRGRMGKTKLTYDFYIGLQVPLKGPDILSPQENADLIWLAKRNSHDTPNGNPYDPLYGNGPDPILPDYLFAGPNIGLFEGDSLADASLYKLNPGNPPIYQIVRFDKNGTDWFHEMYKPAWSQNHTLTVSGGNEKNDYLLSFGYLDQQGTMLNTFLKRFTARVNTDFMVKNALRIGENLQLSYTDNPRPFEWNPPYNVNIIDDEAAALNTDPASPVYDIMGAWNGGYDFGGSAGPDRNPVAVRTLAKDNKAKSWQVFGNAFAELSFLKYFTAKTNFGGGLTNFYNYSFQYATYAYPFQGHSNSLSESSGYLSSLTWNGTLNFSKNFGKEHHVDLLAGLETINNYNREEGGMAFNLALSVPNYWLLGNGDPLAGDNYSIASISKLYSFISRLQYGIKDRYFITGNLRRDGSSIFGPENRYGWFPSIGGAWRITEEKFINKSKWLNELKLRAGWGKTGFYGNTDPSNQFTLYGGSPADTYYDIYGVSSGSIQPGFRLIRFGNTKTSWQQDVVTNIGLDGIFWNGKFSVTADWYLKESRGLLFQIALPDLLGDATSPNVNVGDVRNTGIDLTLGSKGSFPKNGGWDILVTLTHYKNKIIKLNAVPYFFDFSELVKNEVGHPVSSFYGYKIIGFFQDSADIAKSPLQPDAAPGRFKYLDANGDGKISDSDRVLFGSPHPAFTIGINIGFRFKNFDFSTFLYGSFGNDILNLVRNGTDIFALYNPVHSKTALYNSWSPDNKNATAPIQETSYNFSNATPSYGLENGSYLRNKSVIIGYTFSKKMLQKIKLDRLRIYFQVTNLFTITKYTGLDPELPDAGVSPLSSEVHKSTFGIDFGTYPNNQKQFLVGFNVAF